MVSHHVWGGSLDPLARWERLCVFKQMVTPVAIVQTWGEWEAMRVMRICVFMLWGCCVAPDATDYSLNTLLYVVFKLINIAVDSHTAVQGGAPVGTIMEQGMSSMFVVIFAAVAGFLIVVKSHRHMRLSFHLGHIDVDA